MSEACTEPDQPRRRARAVLVTLAVAGIVLALTVRFAPFYLPGLPEAAPPAPDEPQLVFGYATLRNPVIRTLVTGRWTAAAPAELPGMCRVGRNLLPAPDGVVTGRVFEVDPEALRRLDRFEQTGLRYERTLMPLTDGRQAWVYRFLPILVDAEAVGCP